MLPGTITMLFFIIIVVFGGAVALVAMNLRSESGEVGGEESP